MRVTRALAAVLVVAGSALIFGVHAQSANPFNEQLLNSLTYRNTGPFRMQARIASIAVPAAPAKEHLYTFYVAPWVGGVWKTTNNGTTFEPVFDQEATQSVGAIAVDPRNANTVWVGTGDAFTSRSSLAGDGIYRSTDAGKTWTNMGLRDSQHIARVVIDPKDSNIVYVAAMGHLYSDNAERGVFKTTDGGATWQKVLFVNERVGVIDLVQDAQRPGVLYAATYDKQRLPWQIVNGGPGSGIYKTSDSGRTWTKLGGGLPVGRIGRIGLALYPRNPDILYAVIENENARTTPVAAGRGGAAPAQPGVVPTIGGEVYRTADGGMTWNKMNADDYNVSPKGPYYFSQIFVDPNNDQQLFVTQDGFRHSIDGGKTWNAFPVFPRMFGDVRTLWIDPDNSDRLIQGSDGGIAISYDGGRTSDALSNIPLGSVYTLGVDMEDPYNIYAGLQDHEHWRGPSNGPSGRVTEQDWFAVGGGDGIYTVVDPTDSRWLYTTREYGSHFRVDQKLGIRTDIMPHAQAGQPPYRFLWEPPILISPHHSNVIYAGAQMLLKSTDRGDHWTEISPDLSTHQADKIFPESEGGVPGGIPWFAISTMSESPITEGVIWAGTSDGRVHVTRDAGASWADVSARIDALGSGAGPSGVGFYVSRVQASSHVASRAYVSKSGYKFDDRRPFLYTTDDYGATWRSIAGDLPQQPINVIVEDRRNPNLLFVGNDAGVFVSIDRGGHWVRMNNNIPNLPVHDLLVHPRQNDLVVGSYGRGIFVTNIAPLQELSDAVLAEEVHLFTIQPTVQRITWSFGANDYIFGQTHLQTPNEPEGMVIRYYVRSDVASGATVVIADAGGREVARLQGRSAAGINTVVWNTRVGGGRGGRGAAPAPAAAGRGSVNPLDSWMPLGDYTVTLQVGGKTLTQVGRIVKTQGWSIGGAPVVIR
jgi:photosystem II stability/assembly factor-like uncharacterized protein